MSPVRRAEPSSEDGAVVRGLRKGEAPHGLFGATRALSVGHIFEKN